MWPPRDAASGATHRTSLPDASDTSETSVMAHLKLHGQLGHLGHVSATAHLGSEMCRACHLVGHTSGTPPIGHIGHCDRSQCAALGVGPMQRFTAPPLGSL